MTDLHIISIIIATVAVTAVITSLLTSRKMRRKVAYMLDALEDNDDVQNVYHNVEIPDDEE